MVEVASTDTNPSKLPAVEPIQAGKIDTTTTRCFDLFCVGKYEPGSDLKLNIQSAKKIPNLVTKDANGDPVFAEPKAVCTIQGSKGHNIWVNIELKTITTEAPKYMCLGIKKQSENEYYDILCTGNLSRYVDVLETDTVDLVPLISSTELPIYTQVKAGETAKITSDEAYNFGAVYRVHISLHKGQWLTDQKCDLTSAYNYGSLSIGTVVNQSGKILEDQLVKICDNKNFAYSSDGIHWTQNSVADCSIDLGCTYGNGIWLIKEHGNVIRSIDGGRSWNTFDIVYGSLQLGFDNNVFMCTSIDKIFTSPDGEIWTQVGTVNGTLNQNTVSILIRGDDKWICGDIRGYIYCSKDGKGDWELLSTELYEIEYLASEGYYWRGGCYANGYFYVINKHGLIARSKNGKNWSTVFDFTALVELDPSRIDYYNITYYKNKLWAFNRLNSNYIVGLFNPDGTIESLEN